MLVATLAGAAASPLAGAVVTISPPPNTASQPVDNDTVERPVEITAAQLPDGEILRDVTVEVTFRKTDGNCTAFGAGSPFNDEVGFVLESPRGDRVTLVENTRNGAAGSFLSSTPAAGLVTMTFKDSGDLLADRPANGTFQPAVGALADLVSPAGVAISPVGTWTLEVSDSVLEDPLCFESFRLTLEVEAEADLAVTETSVPTATVVAGEVLSYTVTVTNPGPSWARGVMAASDLPAGTKLLSTIGCLEDPLGISSCGLGDLASSSSTSYTVELAIPSAMRGTVDYTAGVTSAAFDPRAADDTATRTVAVVAETDLTLEDVTTTGAAVAGTEIEVAWRVRNLGPSDSSGGAVVDALPEGMAFAGSQSGCAVAAETPGVVSCPFGPLPPGASRTGSFRLELRPFLPVGPLANTLAPVGNEHDPVAANDNAAAGVAVKRETDLWISMSASPEPAALDLPLTYTLTVNNAGPSDSSGGQVHDFLPAGLRFIGSASCDAAATAVASGCDPGASLVRCAFGPLAAGDARDLTFDVALESDAPADVTNCAEISTLFDTAEDDPDSANDRVTTASGLDVALTRVLGLTAGGEAVAECGERRGAFATLRLELSEAVRDPLGNTTAEDVTNPESYLLLTPGADGGFSTEDCDLVLGDDQEVRVAAASYDAGANVVTLSFVGTPSDESLYRLLACDLRDMAGNHLDGDGDGTSGDPFRRHFRATRNRLANGFFDCGLAPWEAVDDLPAQVTHDPLEDASGASVSGAARLASATGNALMFGQCLDVGELEPLALAARLAATRVDAPLTIELDCEQYSQPGCVGTLLGSTCDGGGCACSRTWNPSLARDWEILACPEVTSPAGTDSVLCTAILTTTGSFDVLVDEVMLGAPLVVGTELFVDGFESGNTSVWSARVP